MYFQQDKNRIRGRWNAPITFLLIFCCMENINTLKYDGLLNREVTYFMSIFFREKGIDMSAKQIRSTWPVKFVSTARKNSKSSSKSRHPADVTPSPANGTWYHNPIVTLISRRSILLPIFPSLSQKFTLSSAVRTPSTLVAPAFTFPSSSLSEQVAAQDQTVIVGFRCVSFSYCSEQVD